MIRMKSIKAFTSAKPDLRLVSAGKSFMTDEASFARMLRDNGIASYEDKKQEAAAAKKDDAPGPKPIVGQTEDGAPTAPAPAPKRNRGGRGK